MRANFIQIVSIIVSIICVNAQRRCTTPHRTSGECKNIRSCPPLVFILRSYLDNPTYQDYLKKSVCGFVGKDPWVCCPSDGGRELEKQINFGTPPVQPQATNAPPSQPDPPTQGQKYTLPTDPNCGLTNTTFGRIVGGFPAVPGQFPWIAALGYDKDKTRPKWLCGGSLITQRHILTAGHCVHNHPELYIARLGIIDLYDPSEQPEDVLVERIILHEGYNPTTVTNDIAVLRLSREITNREPYISPICLPLDPDLRNKDFVKYYPFVAGWGSIYFNGPSSPKLQGLQLPVVSNEQCIQAFQAFKTTIIDQRVLCAGFIRGGKDACQGDSGGPLMLPRSQFGSSTVYFQIGVVSYGFRCAEAGFPGVYTRVSEFIQWIQDNLI